MRQRAAVLLVGAGMLSLAKAAQAQVDVDRFQRQLEQIQRDTRITADENIPPEQRALFEYGGFTTFNLLGIGDHDGHTHVLEQYDLTGFARLDLDGVHDFFLRGHTSYRAWNSGDAFDGNDNDVIAPTLDRAIYRFDMARAFGAYEGRSIKGNIVLSGGRQLVNWANGLVLSQELDGALIDFSLGNLTLETLAGVTRGRDVDIDPLRPGSLGSVQRGFYGGMLSDQVTPKFKPYIYGLMQIDQNDPSPLPTATTPATTTNFHYDSFYIGGGASGSFTDNFTYGVELVYEGGASLSSAFDPLTGVPEAQTNDNISAAAADGRLDYLFNDENRSRLSGELLLASGDTDRGDSSSSFGGNKPGTTDTGFNAFGLINTGLAFAPHVSNLLMVRVGASTFPLPESSCFKRLQIGMDLFAFSKLNSVAGFDEPTVQGKSFLGVEPDLYANWQITGDLSLALRYGIFVPGPAIAGPSNPRNFIYTGLTFSF